MQKTQKNQVELELAVKEFYKALNAIFVGDVSPMENLWSHSDDTTYLSPEGGILKGWKEIQKAWNRQANLNLKGEIEPQELHLIQEGNIGVAQNFEVGKNYVDGKPVEVRIRALNLFRKENGGWKMISHQTDLLPFLQK